MTRPLISGLLLLTWIGTARAQPADLAAATDMTTSSVAAVTTTRNPDGGPMVSAETTVEDTDIRQARGVEMGWGLCSAGAFLLIILVSRWFLIAKSTRNFLLCRLRSLQSQLTYDVESAKLETRGPDLSRLQKELSDIEHRIKNESRVSQFLFWSQNLENAAWVELHEVERIMSAYLSPMELVEADLTVALAELRALKTVAASTLADRIDAELHQGQHVSPETHEICRRLLGKGQALIHNARDDNYVSLMDWQNKAMFLAMVGLLLMVTLGALAGNSLLFFAGAVGGLLSRMTRVVQRPKTAVDYGASWGTLFLSPLFGALCGWCGVLLISLLTNPKLSVLGPLFNAIRWSYPVNPSTLAMAIVLGFSERLFQSLVTAAEAHAVAEEQKEAPPRTRPSQSTRRHREPEVGAPQAPTPPAAQPAAQAA